MKKQNNRGPTAIFLALAMGASSVFAESQLNNTGAMEPAVLAGVLASSAIPGSGNSDIDNVAGASNLLWVFGGSLVGLSLVMRRRSA